LRPYRVYRFLGALILVTLFALFILAWELLSKSRAPLAGLLCFLLTVFPLLGFFNVSFFRFSFVADHFQSADHRDHHATFRWMRIAREALNNWKRYVCCAALLVVLAILSWAHAHNFTDQVTCYHAVVKHDPASWTAHLNLGFDGLARHSSEEAREQIDSDIQLYDAGRPNHNGSD
jgi:hypothetical protein